MSNLSVFKFEALEVRAVVIDGAPWFVASDVCAALCHTNTSNPRETQPHWYVASFGELLDMVYGG